MVLEADDEKYESKKENFSRRSSLPMKSENPKNYSTTLSLQILESVKKVGGGLQSKSRAESIPTKEFTISHSPTKVSTVKIELQAKSLEESIPTKEFIIPRSPTKLSTAKIELQPKSLEESIPTKEFTISRSPTKFNTAKIESVYSELPSPSRITKSTTFTMEIGNLTPALKRPGLQPDEPPDSKEDDEDKNKTSKRPSEKQRKSELENIHIKISPSASETAKETTEDDVKKTKEADVNICVSNAESSSLEKNSNMQQLSTEAVAVTTTPVKNGKGKFGGLKKRKSLDKSPRKNSLRKATTGDASSPPSSASSPTPTVIITPSHNGRRDSTSPPLSLPLSLPSQEDGNSSISNIVEYEGGRKTPKKADVETMRAMGLTEERKPKLSSRASFKMWKRSALQYIKSHASNVKNGKMYKMNPDAEINKDDQEHYKNETPDEQQHISTNGDSQLSLCSNNPDVNMDLSPTEAYKTNCSPMYRCYAINTSPYSDEKTRKWRRVRRAFSELYPSRCIDPRISDDEPHNRKLEHKALHRKSLLSMSKTSSQFDLRTLGAIEIDSGSFMSNSFDSELLSLPDKNRDYSESSGKKSKSDKNSVYEPTSESEVTSKSNVPLKSNGLSQTAPHRIDFQKYVIDPNRENYRRSSIADIPIANSSAPNAHASQREQLSKSLESSRTESQLKEETASPKKEKASTEKNVPKEEFYSVSSESSSSNFQLINVSPDSTSTSTTFNSASTSASASASTSTSTSTTLTSTPTTNTSTSQDVSSFPTSQLSSCTTSNNLTTSTSSGTTTSSDDATVSPTFEEYAKAHGGMNFAVGLAVFGGGRPAKDNQTTSRGVTANLAAGRGSVTIANKATSPMSSEMGKENGLPPNEEASLNKRLQTEEPQGITRNSFTDGFRRTQEISCRLLSPDQATATRNTYLVPSKSISPGSVTTRYPRRDVDIAPGKTDSNARSALSSTPKSESDETTDKKEPESERYNIEDISKVRDTDSVSDSKTISNDQELSPVPPPRRRLKENSEGKPTISPSILKKPVLASSRSKGPVVQEERGKDRKELDSPSLTKIPTSRMNISNQNIHTGSCEKSVSPFKVRKITKPVSPLPNRNFSPKPLRASKSMPSSPDLNTRRELRIAGGLSSSPESTPKRTTRIITNIPSSPEISSRISRPLTDRQPGAEPGSPKRSRLAAEKTMNLEKKTEAPAKDPDVEGASTATKASCNKILFSEAAPLKNSRMTTTATGKQVNPETGVAKTSRVMTPKRVNVNTGLQVVLLPAPGAKAISTDPSKNSRIPVCKPTRPDVIPKKSGRLAMNRLTNPHLPTEKTLRSTKTVRPASAHAKYPQSRSEETRIPSSVGGVSERPGLPRTMSCEVETGSPTHQPTNKTSLSNSTRSIYKDLEKDITSHEAKLSPVADSHFKLTRNTFELEQGDVASDEPGVEILEISREDINAVRKRHLLVKTMSCEAESGSPTDTPIKSMLQQDASSPHSLVTKEKTEESPSSVGEVKKQDAAAQTTSDETSQKIGKVITTGAALLSTLKQDMAAQTNENELQTGLSTAVCGIVPIPIVTRQTPHQIKMGGAALRARANTDQPDANGTKQMSRALDHRWELPGGYTDHVQQLMVVEEGQARLYDLKPASCQSIQLLSPSEYSLGSATSTDHSGSPDPYIIESASIDRSLGSLVNSRYRYNLSNSMAGGLDAIAKNSAEHNTFESSDSFRDGNLENIPRRRRAASLSNIELPGKAIDKKNRKRSRLSTFFDIFQRKKKSTLISNDVDLPTHFRVIGRILEMCLDGTRIIELTQPPHGLCGIYMTRVKHTYGYGIYISRFCDGYPAKMFAGLLAIGDQILEINGVPTDKMTVEEAHDMVASRDTLILRVMPDPNNYRVSTLPR